MVCSGVSISAGFWLSQEDAEGVVCSTEGLARCACLVGVLGVGFQNLRQEVVPWDCFKLWEYSEQRKVKFTFM